ncbi:M17 family metallopeptidase, partial [uncultured Desulfovibrio sp.]
RRVVGLLACAENMPDGGAYRPGDVLTAANGDSVEVINTDAEGRLALCDALAWAQKRWTPAAIVDIATLTGACAVALGTGLAGLFCDDDGLAERLAAAGATGGEHFWRLPLWRPYADQLKSEVADIRHTAGREGGAITAALFLRHFVREGELWAHLDIAGVDWNAKATPLCPEGASGFGARTLLELARGGIQ